MACTLSAEQIKSVKPQGFLHNKGTDCFNGRVITVNGKITAAQTKVIAEADDRRNHEGNGNARSQDFGTWGILLQELSRWCSQHLCVQTENISHGRRICSARMDHDK